MRSTTRRCRRRATSRPSSQPFATARRASATSTWCARSRCSRGSGVGMAAETVHHPLFARMYQRVAAAAMEKGEAEFRREMLAGLTGSVIEVGAGHGLNFSLYPASVPEVLAVEPEAVLRRGAEEAARTAAVAVRVVDGVASRLPADDATFDGVVASLVLCSVPDQGVALSEMFRVLRPGGELRFYEHVVADTVG